MITPTRLNDGTLTRYGMGMEVTEDQGGHRYLGHSGGGFGFSAVARWYPAEQLAVVVLTNSEPDSITAVANALAATMLPPAKVAGRFEGDPALLIGKYRGPGRKADAELVVEVTQVAGGLAMSIDGGDPEPLTWADNWTFRCKDSVTIFRNDGKEGPAKELRLDTVGDHFVLTKL